jgi:hypothetical protein
MKKGRQIREELNRLLDAKVDLLSEESLSLKAKVEGWDTVLRDKLLEDGVGQDLHLVNVPEELGTQAHRRKLEADLTKRQYIYSAFLPAGHHQFMIYE